ncbi:uncharacterized protein V6R79_023643 [Siganus canaliculatus]
MALRYTASQLLGLRHRTPPSTDLIARLKDLGLLLRRRYIHRGSRRNFFYNFSSANSIPSLWCDRCMDAGSRTSVLRHHNTTRHQILRSTRSISFRNIKSVDPLLLSQSISSTFPTDSAPSSPEAYAILLNSTLSTSLDALAPLKTATVSFSSSSPWFTPSLRKMKQTGRQLERLSRKSNLTVHAEAYRVISLPNTNRDALQNSANRHKVLGIVCRPGSRFEWLE